MEEDDIVAEEIDDDGLSAVHKSRDGDSDSESGTWSLDAEPDDESTSDAGIEDEEISPLSQLRTSGYWFLEPSVPAELWRKEVEDIGPLLSKATQGFADIIKGESGGVAHVGDANVRVRALRSGIESLDSHVKSVRKVVQTLMAIIVICRILGSRKIRTYLEDRRR